MKKLLLLLILLLTATWLNAQVVITATDMPDPGDTLRSSVTFILEGIDYQVAGENYTWDFSGLTVMMQQVDTFVAVSSTPIIYQAVFNNQFLFPDYKATVAKKMGEFGLIPSLEITDAYQFFKETTEEYREVGVGITLAGVPLPITYQQIDTIYRFPLQYGNVDSAHSAFNIDVPDLGYLGFVKKRKNIADGWGTLITPFGQFQTLRVRTEIQEYDSIYIDSLNMGYPINRFYTEYKWLANGYCLPLLTVNEEGLVVTATYADSVRTTFVGMKEDESETGYSFKVYPNPASDYLSVSYELLKPSQVQVSFYTLHGEEVKRIIRTNQEHGLYNRLINIKETGLKPGLYLLILQIDQHPMVKRVVVK